MFTVAQVTYSKIKEIGAGQGMNSKVFLAQDPQIGGQVAAKEIDKSRIPDPAQYFAEAQAMFAASHDNVVEIKYGCQTATTICLVMPYYRRGSLKPRIEQCPLQLSEVLRIAQGVLAGLASIHLKGFIHFDVKPSNILFSDRNVPMVADFGQSRAISPTGVVNVPPMYLPARPPETIRTSVASAVADIYHVGLTMYQALNGYDFYAAQIPPSDAALERQILRGELPDRSSFLPHVPPRMRTMVRKALKVDPAKRFQSAVEMSDALSHVGLPLDWSVERLPPSGFRWKATRPDRCDLIVELRKQGSGWEVRTFTQRDACPMRAKAKGSNWQDGLTLDDAYAHLSDVFESISE